ncbi:MAG: ABC transporter ATP-binding protein/permease [Levilactobacillus sp.]|jgi:ATP-binding cassette subfamily B protein|uniref:ABC transporter ATP-binding protein n=1 Tax=Levilactobacillus sp. TaxID=2767919 RepID=UPI00258C07BE|nr:ABC transporter ATP-binding protein [Levilactobacillus sp.]MCH4123944.1 ABC transporter ATP-binding protein/permease [Levilactobacillus sp.]MCI1554220.1 ABC transporter ATP-binding protein/permease [Levilactobacillus sp.]MCI1598804.1 ABC transporter ATP-binding protein/permease [Levilactobacillus sp.]MCI1605425.1 ABC transporter ATP-binding protein/permease [Levilactobacillus sp.]
MRNGRGAATKQRPQKFWGTTFRLFRYMKAWLPGIFVVLVFAVVSVILQIRTPKILGEATTELFKGVMKGTAELKAGIGIHSLPVNFDKIGHILLVVGIMYAGAALFGIVQQLIMSWISQKVVYRLRRDLKEKMQRLPISYYDTHSNGDLMSRMANDMDNIGGTLQQTLSQMVTSVLTFFGVLYMMLTISGWLTLVALISVPLSVLVVGIVAPKSQRFFASQQKNLGLLNNTVEETYAGHTVVKTFNREESTQAEFEEHNQKYYQSAWKAQFVSSLIFPLMNFVKNLDYLAVAVIGGIQVANGTVSLGNVQAFLQYTNQFSQPITQMANLTNTIQATIASAERIFDVLDESDMVETKTAEVPAETAPNGNVIEFDNVAFRYVENNPLIEDFNLKVKPGDMVAIVGPTGAGKTTIINLLERFYDVDSGQIRYRGQDTHAVGRTDLRRHFAMVLQDTWLFTGSIFDNIKYGRENATEDDVYAAAKAAHADTFIRQLPDGYDTILNEAATNISQGQRQLLTIARAFVADPDVLILDEATSSVDTRTEMLIQHAMQRLLAGRTSFVVAHRLSTIQNAENIVVMNHGHIVETGNHDSLLAANGFYADLYNSQFTGNDLA